MRDRLKILDCNRKGILGLPDGALKVWMTRYMMEDDEQESWLSLPEVEAITSQAHATNVKWHKHLVAHGWLVDTGKTAYDKLLALGKTPSANSKQVKVYRVDDPTSSKISPSSKIEHKVYSYGSGSRSSSLSGSESHSQDWPTSTSVNLRLPVSNSVVEPKPQTKTNSSLAPDGSSWKEWDVHDQAWHTAKLIELGITEPGPSAPPNKEKAKTQKASGGGLRAFLEEGNPVRLGNHDSSYFEDLDSEEL
jgi:hypothetical protein